MWNCNESEVCIQLSIAVQSATATNFNNDDGQLMFWDATSSDTLAPSYLHLNSTKSRSVARKSANTKSNRYKEFSDQGHFIVAFAIEKQEARTRTNLF